jgi:dihydroxyacetone kinase-like predicted kinase
MVKSIDMVATASTTFAARDSIVNGQQVQKGQILGMENGKITIIENDVVKAAYKATRHLYKKHSSLITIIYGQEATQQQAQQLEALFKNKFQSAEISTIDGGQPVYHFIISIE